MSNLLPKSNVQEFQLKEYWDNFFTRRTSSFEWYGEYTDLCHILHKYLRTSSEILVVGCGNSKLSGDLYDAGFHKINNIDVSSIVIQQMMLKNKKRKDMTFCKMDVLDMSFEDSVFDCVLDKGTLDTIFSGTDDVTVQKVNRMFDEVGRVLRIAGRYICITLAQQHILEKLLRHFESGWLIRVHKVKLAVGADVIGGALPVFVFICTKMAQKEGVLSMKVYEYVMDDGKCVRYDSVGKVGEIIRDNQEYAMIECYLSKLHVGEAALQLDLWLPSISEEPRYTLSVIDLHKRRAKNGSFAVFIVPQGREIEWLFSSDAGRLQLAESAGYERLVVVTMHRSHTYPNLADVKEEVSTKAVELLQQGLPYGKQYPVLTLGDGLGSRVVLHEGLSAQSGKYIVEECDGEGGGRVRRLVFLSSPGVAQTEINVIPAAKLSRKKKSRTNLTCTKLDHSRLVFDYHNVMVASLGFLPGLNTSHGLKQHVKVLLIGLGGGALPTFINKYLYNLTLDVVELDSEMLSVAEKSFGFVQGERMNVFIGDGIQFIKESCSAGKKDIYDVIMLDVNSTDAGIGMTCPPEKFLEQDFLESCKLLLSSSGIIITNLAARNKAKRTIALKSFHEIFHTLLSIDLPEDVNEVLVGLLNVQNKDDIVSGGKKVNGEMGPGCNMFVGCHITENAQKGIARLCNEIEACSSSEIKIDTLQSELLSCISKVCYYEHY